MFIIFKHLFLWNHSAYQSQILCGNSFGRGNINSVIRAVTWTSFLFFSLNLLANQSLILCGASLGRGNIIKFIKIVLVTWPKWLPCQNMNKTFKTLLQNQLHAELVTQVQQRLYKWWLDWPYSKVNLVQNFLWLYTQVSVYKTIGPLISWRQPATCVK